MRYAELHMPCTRHVFLDLPQCCGRLLCIGRHGTDQRAGKSAARFDLGCDPLPGIQNGSNQGKNEPERKQRRKKANKPKTERVKERAHATVITGLITGVNSGTGRGRCK